MKRMNILLVSALLIGTSALAFTPKVKEPILVKGTSIGEYKKPGAPVDISYISEHVESGDVSRVVIVLMTRVKTGMMKVKVKLGKGLEEISNVDKQLSYDLDTDTIEYPLNMEVSAEEDGLYYIKLHVSIKGKGMRAFAVPVYFGEGKIKTQNTAVAKTQEGENIIVSPAQETITKE
jgi:LEA14-like dessication related protein